MARNSKKEAGGSLDSLLDTMTNVVGILVIVLALTQTGMREAVERISANDQVDPQELEAAEKAAAAAATKVAEQEQELAQFSDVESNISARELARLEQLIIDLQADLKSLTFSRENEIKEIEQKIADALKKIAEQKKKEDELEKSLNVKQDRLAALLAQLEAIPVRNGPPPKVIRLPNPRKAPEGAVPITYMCRGGMIGYMDLPEYQNRAQKWTTNTVMSKPIYGNLKTGFDCAKLFTAFNRLKLKDRNFEYRLIARGRAPYLELTRRTGFGESLEEISAPTSDYIRQLKQIDPSKYYLQFIVWPDSFETYIKAREMATSQGILAGWQTNTNPAQHLIRLQGQLLCVQPPQPQPPKAKPPKPAQPPNAKPPQPAQPPRPVPLDTID
ncbi:MAG: hypothetical protein ACI9G1_002454 [Pirellulaceae bacterium]|jgi:hypothetical protein